MTLEEAIEQQITLGQKDPLTIVEKLLGLYGQEWLHEQAAFLAPDIAAEIARRKLGEKRRKFEVALRPGQPLATAEMKTASFCVPATEHGFTTWKKAADVTAEDLRAKADWYDRFALGALKRSRWCRDVASLMEEEGAATLGALDRELPALPADEDMLVFTDAA